MEIRSRHCLSVLFLLFSVGHVFCETIAVGTNKTFKPVATAQIVGILWKFQNHKVVEYDNGGEPKWYRFEKGGSLDKKTGTLTLEGLTKEQSGLYQAEIQVSGKPQLENFDYKITVIDPVSKPAVTCTVDSTDEATLLCSVERGDQAVFEWSAPNEVKHSGARLSVSKEESHNTLFMCTAKNDVSQVTTEFLFKDCFPDESTSVGASIGAVIGALVIGLGVVLGGIFCWKKKIFSKNDIEQGTEEGKNKVKNEEKNECEMPLLPKEKTVTEGKKDGDENATTDLTDNEEDQRQDSTAVEQSVQNETEVKKEQQDNTTNTANSILPSEDEEKPESTKENDENSPVVTTEQTPAEDEDNASSNVDDNDESVEKHDGAPGPQSNSEEGPESIGGKQSFSSVPTVLGQSCQDKHDSSNAALEAKVPPSNDEETPESTENEENSLVVPTEETLAADEDNSSSNIEDEDKSEEKQSAAGDGQTVTTTTPPPPIKQPLTGNNHSAISPVPGTVEKTIEKYENYSQKPKVLLTRDADQKN